MCVGLCITRLNLGWISFIYLDIFGPGSLLFFVQFLFGPFLPCRGLTQEVMLSYDQRGAHFSMALFFEVSVRLRSAKPGNVQTNWTGMTSYQADYCHPLSGEGGSTGYRLCLTCSHMIERAVIGEGRSCRVRCTGCSEVSRSVSAP